MGRGTEDVATAEVRLDLVADNGASKTARDALRRTIADQPATVQEDASLVLSEIVSNSVKHGPSGLGTELSVLLVVDAGTLRVEVSDHAPALPVRKPPTSEGGYGLNLVEAIASRWGAERKGDGNVSWFEMELPPRPPLVRRGGGRHE